MANYRGRLLQRGAAVAEGVTASIHFDDGRSWRGRVTIPSSPVTPDRDSRFTLALDDGRSREIVVDATVFDAPWTLDFYSV